MSESAARKSTPLSAIVRCRNALNDSATALDTIPYDGERKTSFNPTKSYLVPSFGSDGMGFSTYRGFWATGALPIVGALAFDHTAEVTLTASSSSAFAVPVPSLGTINSGSR